MSNRIKFEIKTNKLTVKLNVTTQTEIDYNLKACFEKVLDDHYSVVLQGFDKIENILL